MVKIYFETDDKGYVDGWGSTRSKDDEVELEIDKGHDFFESDSHAWKYVEGNLVFDEERNKELLEENDKKKPSKEEVRSIAILELAERIAALEGGE
ncbi:hypothetical protein ACFSMW_10600 [Virgibacillus halophilus]|uniref:hypothetical protein n=1 Tax=Tigheibacillus halophilus TaxID=361280 RepID=UPI00362EB6AD